jgi:hypothetical protein
VQALLTAVRLSQSRCALELALPEPLNIPTPAYPGVAQSAVERIRSSCFEDTPTIRGGLRSKPTVFRSLNFDAPGPGYRDMGTEGLKREREPQKPRLTKL